MSFNVIRVAKATDNDPIKVEKPAAASILPGNVLLANASGQFILHNVPNGAGMLFVADVNMHDGLADAYGVGDTVQAYQPVSGEVYRLRSITAQAYVKDVTPVTSTGSGTIDIATGTDVIIGYADETVTTSAGNQLVRIKFK